MRSNVVQTSHSIIIASAYPAVMSTWWMEIVSEWLKMAENFYDVCAVFSQGRKDYSSGVCLILGKVMVS